MARLPGPLPRGDPTVWTGLCGERLLRQAGPSAPWGSGGPPSFLHPLRFLIVFPSSRAKTTRVTSVTSAWRPGGLGAPAGVMSGRRVRLSVGSHVPPWHLGESFWEDLTGLCPDGALPQRPEEELSGPVGSPHRGRSAHGHPGGRLRCERMLLGARRLLSLTGVWLQKY